MNCLKSAAYNPLYGKGTDWEYLNDIIGLTVNDQLSAIRQAISKHCGNDIHLEIAVGDTTPFFIYIKDGHRTVKLPVILFECEEPPIPPVFNQTEAERLFNACQNEFKGIASISLNNTTDKRHANKVLRLLIYAQTLENLVMLSTHQATQASA